MQRIDVIKSTTQRKPVLTVELPDFARRGAEDATIRSFGEGENIFGAKLVCGDEAVFLLVLFFPK